ncbi:Major intracellular serine protease [Colletotrichum tanaceti]|uniref:Major intracellular serine protease n=1 Tax=Colletotrichum tanaceti TaxID=1306861 RepID=A0A4V6DH38_9PEZI|nr:Major intracellular serine protease [Colletotrichum tanaceti]TKW48646.1 Major intracellular serine protease [Colletotrichum tanaceti]
MAAFRPLDHDVGSSELLREVAGSFLQMAVVARLNDSNGDSKVFYSHLALNCARLHEFAKASLRLDAGLVSQALAHLGSLIPTTGVPELPAYFAKIVEFVSRWVGPVAPGRDLDLFDGALESCVDEICRQQPVQSRDEAGNVSVSGIDEPSFAVRKAAQSVFNALLSCKDCACSCPHRFGAKLELGTYRKPTKPAKRARRYRIKNKTAEALDFKMFLSMERNWNEVRVHTLKETQVGFCLLDDSAVPHGKSASAVFQSIKTLCAPITRTQSKPLQRLELKLTGNQLFEMGFEKTNFRIDKSTEAISLAQCIKEHHEWFTEKTKRVLSLIVAYTVFHLDDTSWLPPGWGSANIKFFQTTSQEVPLRPFIETQLSSRNDVEDEPCDPFVAKDLDSYHLFPALISLAVVLMEVYFVKPFERLAHMHNIQLIETADGSISLIDVDQVFNGVEDEDGGGGDWGSFGDNLKRRTKREEEGWRAQIPEDYLYLLTAIDNCLDSEQWEDEEGQPLDHQTLRSRMYQKVVRPLELHLTHGFSNIPLDGVDEHAREINFAQWGHVIPRRESEELVSSHLSSAITPDGRQSPASLSLAQNQIGANAMGVEYWRGHPQSLFPFLALHPSLNIKPSFSVGDDSHSARFFDDEVVLLSDGSSRYEIWKHRYKDVYEKYIANCPSSATTSNPVRIAILDTGIDGDHPVFDAYGDLKDKHNCFNESHKRRVTDSNGHGTFAASLIREYAPDADLYVIKIAGRDNARPDAQVVRKAIDYAVDEWQVDIISMSFGWPSSDFDGYGDLQEAIDRAHHRKVLMFAAASNSGGNLGRAYPASSPHVTCVHSTDTFGNRSNFSPTPERNAVNIATVGDSVRSAWPIALCDDGPDQDYLVSRSGTSYATPILAGIAAFLLHYARLHLPESAAAMKRKENMEAVLKRCAERGPKYSPRDGYLYVELSLYGHNMFGGKLEEVNHEILQALKK